MIWVHRQLLKLRFYYLFIEWTKDYVLPGFSPIPLYDIGAFFFKEIGKESLVNKASSLAYNFMLAIFPGIIFLFSLIPYIPRKIGFQDRLMVLLELILPTQAYKAFETTIFEIIKIQNGRVLSFGIILAIFFATNGLHNLMKAFNKASLTVDKRTWLRQRLIAFVLTCVIAFSLIITITAMTAGEIALNYINKGLQIDSQFIVYIIEFSRWALLGVLYFVTISILYRYGPANPKKWRFFSAGSWLATILAFLTIWGFSFYINQFESYNKVYGSIGTLMVIMIWLYLNSLILLIGFELNASVDLSKKSVRIIKQPFNLFKNNPPERK